MKVEYIIKPEEVVTLVKIVKLAQLAITTYASNAMKNDIFFAINTSLNKDELELSKQIFDLKSYENIKVKIQS